MASNKIFIKWSACLIELALVLQLTLLPDSQAADPTPTVPSSIPPTARQLPSPTPSAANRSLTPPPLATSSPRPPQTNPVISPTTTTRPTVTPTPGPKLQSLPPVLHSSSALAVDADTGRILFAQDIHTKKPMASTTKITTALSFLSLYPTLAALQTETTVQQDDLVGEANMGLRKEERIKLATVLLGLLTNSANESGMVLARYAGQQLAGPADPVDRFVAYMNTYALSLGMYESHYMNPHGLDQPGHYTTAYDLAIAGWWAIHNPLFLQSAQYVGGELNGHSFYNVNSFLTRYPGATGVKPGFTDDAGHCLVASAYNNGHSVIVVVLNDPQMAADTDALMDYSFTLLAGRASQPVASLNLGSLIIPRSGLPQSQARPVITAKAIQAALRVQLDYTLRLAISVFLQ